MARNGAFMVTAALQKRCFGNAFLISAAPDLYEALERLVDEISEWDRPCFALEDARAVLAKANPPQAACTLKRTLVEEGIDGNMTNKIDKTKAAASKAPQWKDFSAILGEIIAGMRELPHAVEVDLAKGVTLDATS